jgi:hypothetical protein
MEAINSSTPGINYLLVARFDISDKSIVIRMFVHSTLFL